MARTIRGTLSSDTPSGSKRKVKTGCRTCKIRKVKCDETWPVCQRCQTSGRTCDGYGVWGGGNATAQSGVEKAHGTCSSSGRSKTSGSSQTSPVPDICAVDAFQQKQVPMQPSLCILASEEQGHFEWYWCRSVKKLPGAYVSTSWDSLVFQLSSSEPSVMHAMLALAATHRNETQGLHRLSMTRADKRKLLATTQYNKALVNMQKRLGDRSGVSIRTALMSTVLFVSMEFLRGQYRAGVLHLEYGLRILAEELLEKAAQDTRPASYIDGWLIISLMRHLVQCRFLGQDVQCPRLLNVLGEPEPGVEIFRSIHHARRVLEHTILRIFDLRYELLDSRFKGKSIDSAFIQLQQTRLQSELAQWIDTYDTTFTAFQDTMTPYEHVGYRFLQLYHKMAMIMVGIIENGETAAAYDSRLQDFLHFLQHSIDSHRLYHHPVIHRDEDRAGGHSITDMGWITPLYFTALNCRNHRVRMQCIRLMEAVPHKEAIWDADLVTIVARKVVELEEQGLYPVDEDYDVLDPPSAQDLDTPPVPECMRFDRVSVTLPADSTESMTLSCSRMRLGQCETVELTYDLTLQIWVENSL